MPNKTFKNFGESDAVILCGGLGERMRNVIKNKPKSMADINGRPFLDILIDYVSGFGVKRIVLCTGHQSESIKDYYTNKECLQEIVFSNEETPLGTGGAIKNAEKLIKSRSFLVINGDSHCPVNLQKFYEFHLRNDAVVSMVILEAESSMDYGIVTLDASQKVVSFEEKRENLGEPFINSGIYFFERDVLALIPTSLKYSLEYELFPKLIGKGFYGYKTQKKLIDIGTPKRYELAKCFLKVHS
jgi:D-glycero-alpha-D-manno-heptose 1-phosphate guanylyltransferase